jgi:flavin-dependent dehydrogenase
VLHHCNPAPIARYIDTEIWALCLTLGALIGGIFGGGVNFAVFSRERAARIAAETLAAEERKLREEERKLREAERIAERQRVDQLVERLAENQRQVVEAQRQAAETQQATLSIITALTAELTELRRQRNGENGH